MDGVFVLLYNIFPLVLGFLFSQKPTNSPFDIFALSIGSSTEMFSIT